MSKELENRNNSGKYSQAYCIDYDLSCDGFFTDLHNTLLQGLDTLILSGKSQKTVKLHSHPAIHLERLPRNVTGMI